MCTPGTYNDEEGSSSQSACTQCPAGTWSSSSGAESEDECLPCAAGTYQPALGQANSDLCIRCEPGKYSPVAGVAACLRCPAGTWSEGFQSTSCNVCPRGQWTFSEGAMHSTDCTPCHGSRYCLDGASARVTVEVLNLKFSLLSEGQLSEMRSAFASSVAEVLGLDLMSVKDLFDEGGSSTAESARTAGGVGTKLSCFVTVPDGSSTNTMAGQLYTAAFRSDVVQATVAALGGSTVAVMGTLSAPVVTINPEHFVPLELTTTITTLDTTVTTSSSSAATTTSTVHMDIRTTSEAFLSSSPPAPQAPTSEPEDSHKSAALHSAGQATVLVWLLAAFSVRIA